MKPAIVVLVVACLGLSAGLIIVKQQAEARVKAIEKRMPRSIAEWDEMKTKFTDLEKLYAIQQTTLDKRGEELANASNALARANEELGRANSDLKNNQQRIIGFKKDREDLTKKMDELSSSIHKLEVEIADAYRKLATAEGDKNFLLSEVKRLQTEKDALVHQFNDLAVLRARVAHLREEAAVKQRLEWKRLGVYAMQEQKGAERLVAKNFVPTDADNRLDIEIHQNGTRRFVPTSGSPPDGAAP
jgi:chromosome segregation ATPase